MIGAALACPPRLPPLSYPIFIIWLSIIASTSTNYYYYRIPSAFLFNLLSKLFHICSFLFIPRHHYSPTPPLPHPPPLHRHLVTLCSHFYLK